MRAVYYESHGTADVLQIGELEKPSCSAEQVLVEVAAAGVNPIDRRLRAGELQEYIQRTFPVTPGFDFSGRIAEVGEAVADWQVGDEIMGLAFTWSIQHGTYAEFAPVDATAIARKPLNASFAQAAGIPLVSLTTWQSLLELGRLSAGKTVLIQAGAGGVGSVAIPMAKYLGATVYTTASAANADYVRALGADVVIDYQKESYESAILSAEPEGVDMVLEALLGDGTDEAAIRITKSGGAVAYMNNEPPDMRDISDRGIRAEFIHHRADGAMLSELGALYEQDILPLPQIETLPMTAAVEAHLRSESRRTRGKLVLSIANL